MGQVNVMVNGRAYSVGCDDGEEAHVAELAEYVDMRVREMVGSGPQMGGEGRLLLMAALMIADDLSAAADQVEGLRNEVRSLREALGSAADESGSIARLAGRLEDIAARLESA